MNKAPTRQTCDCLFFLLEDLQYIVSLLFLFSVMVLCGFDGVLKGLWIDVVRLPVGPNMHNDIPHHVYDEVPAISQDLLPEARSL